MDPQGDPLEIAALAERIVLPVRPGTQPSAKPPVRIFLGSEPAQYRAERSFLWSIERVRNPGRVYEIHLMKDLPGFRRWFWNTGFTNYRFAVPDLAGRRGRAIYNDVDQIYLADPGELFDLDLGAHGFLAVSERDTSVMLMDCERMAKFWSLDAARWRRKYALIRAALAVDGIYGLLEPEWNARDDAALDAAPRLIHHTILHKQPWRPFPERFHYQLNPQAGAWFDIERGAERAGFHVFGPDRPSRAYVAYRSGLPESPVPGSTSDGDPLVDDAVRDLVKRSQSASLLELAPGMNLCAAIEEGRHAARFDGVVCAHGLDALPPEDVPWAVDQLFRRADRFVFAAVRCKGRPGPRWGRPLAGTVGRCEWWAWVFQSAAKRHLGVHWELALHEGRRLATPALEVLHGGPRLESKPPSVWVIGDHKPGHRTQSLGLTEELGWEFERRDLSFRWPALLPNFLLGTTLLGVEPESAARLAPPWPDLVIATGRRAARAARWVRARSRGRTRAVVMGRMGGFHGERFDLATAPAYSGLYPDPRRIETALPLTSVRGPVLEAAAVEWKGIFERAAGPRIALLVGGSDPMHAFTPDVARRMGSEIARMARRCGGSVFVTTSRRTRTECADALEAALGDSAALFHHWTPGGSSGPNPYMALLALADALIVTGESASMLAEACASGKPVWIYPLPEASSGLRVLRAAADAVASRALARPENRRGIERPQRGLERLCAKLVAEGIVPPFSEIRRMHEFLVEQGMARIFDENDPIPETPAPELEPSSDVVRVADAVRELVGVRTLR